MRITLLFCIVLGALFAKAQPFQKDYFRSPIDFPLQIVGNFGELRNNHFHNGLDIRTGGMEGKNIYSVADGYVSRIKVSSVGYGNVIYITHPNGYVSVYAHLQRFKDSIASYVRKAQYLNETFEIELFPDKKTLPVKKGQIVALSGNTGSSQGPHLHFEIREEETEFTVNPLLFGFDLPDNVPPIIKSVFVYPLDENSYVNGANKYRKIPAVGSKGDFRLKIPEKPEVYGTFGFAIDAIDQMTGLANPNGVYSIEVKVDGQTVHSHKMNKVSFDENRYINAHCDYEAKMKQGVWIQKCFIQPGNKLETYHRTTNNGYLNFDKPGEHQVLFIVKDIEGNTSMLNMSVNYIKQLNFQPLAKLKPEYKKIFYWDKPNNFKTRDFFLDMPAYTIYDNINFKYATSITDSMKAGSYSALHYVHDAIVPIHSYYTIGISAANIAPEFRTKAVIVQYSYGGAARCEGGEYENGFIKAKTRGFGGFKIILDKTAPTIRPVNIIPGKSMAKARAIVCKISDNLCGLKTYKAYIDGKWVLGTYLQKAATLTVPFSEVPGLLHGIHTFKLVVTDNKENQSVYEAKFYR